MDFLFKRRANHILLIICLFSFFTCCRMDKCEFGGSTDISFLIGIPSEKFTLVSFESTIKIIAPPHSDAQYSLDVNNDGHLDFILSSDHSISPGGVDQQESSVEIINPEIEISVLEQSDTFHECFDEYSVPELNITMSEVTTYTRQSNFLCPETGNDTITMIYKDLYPKVYNESDTLNSSEQWSNQRLTFIFFNNSMHTYPSSVENVYIKEVDSVVRGLWDNKSMKYLLFRI